mmetsp:Transcript_2705/g.7805  ORF Transcript_2705/g.7805 Transcript_2705/m.7805 type:complete len:410 (+) Transcript_2705:395-1624(+)
MGPGTFASSALRQPPRRERLHCGVAYRPACSAAGHRVRCRRSPILSGPRTPASHRCRRRTPQDHLAFLSSGLLSHDRPGNRGASPLPLCCHSSWHRCLAAWRRLEGPALALPTLPRRPSCGSEPGRMEPAPTPMLRPRPRPAWSPPRAVLDISGAAKAALAQRVRRRLCPTPPTTASAAAQATPGFPAARPLRPAARRAHGPLLARGRSLEHPPAAQRSDCRQTAATLAIFLISLVAAATRTRRPLPVHPRSSRGAASAHPPARPAAPQLLQASSPATWTTIAAGAATLRPRKALPPRLFSAPLKSLSPQQPPFPRKALLPRQLPTPLEAMFPQQASSHRKPLLPQLLSSLAEPLCHPQPPCSRKPLPPQQLSPLLQPLSPQEPPAATHPRTLPPPTRRPPDRLSTAFP